MRSGGKKAFGVPHFTTYRTSKRCTQASLLLAREGLAKYVITRTMTRIIESKRYSLSNYKITEPLRTLLLVDKCV